MPARLIVISGPSGAGKSTLTRRAVAAAGPRARLTVSATTRAPREGEVPGVDYEFLDEGEFQRAIGAGYFLEWAEYAGNLYGTPVEQVDRLIAGGVCPVLDIEVQGALSVRGRYPGALLVWVRPPSEAELERRLRGRGSEGEAAIAARLEAARRDERHLGEYDRIIENDDVDRAVGELVALIEQHGCGS